MRLFVHILKLRIKSLCKLIVKPVENNDLMPSSNFEFPVFKMEEEDDDEIPYETYRLLESKEKTIQPHKEPL